MDSPAAQARAVVEAMGESWLDWLEHALLSGYHLWNSPSAFVLAREIWDGQAWEILLAAGDMAEFFRVEPPGPPKKWVAFTRAGNPTHYPYERIKRLCCHGKFTKSPSSAASLACTRAG